MASTMMTIPEIINVGYQKRSDTYTGKLAYVVYTDVKGKLRKEKSWRGWCSDQIKKDEFKNEPTEGFVLNKGVGGQRQSYGWNARNEYIRVYDPRDFEFEISVSNLLFILQECSSIKGKGLEGKFVYSWNGADLILLPCCSQEYTECVKYNENMVAKVTKDQMVEGCTYQMKSMINVMYLGRHPWFSKEYDWSVPSKNYLKSLGKRHIFLDIDSNQTIYKVEKGFTNIAKRTSDEAIADYANAYEKMQNSIHCLVPTEVVFKKITLKKDPYSEDAFIKKDDEYYSVSVTKRYYQDGGGYDVRIATNPFIIPEIKEGSIGKLNKLNVIGYTSCSFNKEIKSLLEVNKMEFYRIFLINSKGASYSLI